MTRSWIVSVMWDKRALTLNICGRDIIECFDNIAPRMFELGYVEFHMYNVERLKIIPDIIDV